MKTLQGARGIVLFHIIGLPQASSKSRANITGCHRGVGEGAAWWWDCSGQAGRDRRRELPCHQTEINKDLQAARNLALKPCKTTWSERAYCLLGYKSIELDSSRRPLCSLQRSTVPETQSSASAFPVWRMGVRQ